MRRVRLVALAVSVFLSSSIVVAEAPPQKSSTALQVLRAAVQATGWNRALPPLDITAQGTITRYHGNINTSDTGTIVVKWRGGNSTIETTYGDEHVRFVIEGDIAQETAQATPAYYHSRAFRTGHLPFVHESLNFEDDDWRIDDLAIENVGGEQAYKIKLWRELPRTVMHWDEVRRSSETVLWISTTTSLPVQMQYMKGTTEDRLAFTPRIRRFSDYRRVRGRMVPFRHDEVMPFTPSVSVPTLSIQFTSIDFDTGLPDEEFHVRRPQGGK